MTRCQDKTINEAAGFYDLKPCAADGARLICYKGAEYSLCSKHFDEFLSYLRRVPSRDNAGPV